jgi:hypothetical protein
MIYKKIGFTMVEVQGLLALHDREYMVEGGSGALYKDLIRFVREAKNSAAI